MVKLNYTNPFQKFSSATRRKRDEINNIVSENMKLNEDDEFLCCLCIWFTCK